MLTSSSVVVSDKPWPESPLGVIQFHGAFLFGSCPERHYAPLLDALHERGYPSVLHQFPLDPLRFNHWSVALSLLVGRTKIVDQVRIKHGIKAADFCADPTNSCWLGHSLGCKYLLILEVLSLSRKTLQETLYQVLGIDEASHVLREVEQLVDIPSVQDQPTVLLAPEVSNTIRLFKSDWQLDFGRSRPNRKSMEMLLRSTPGRFNLTDVISFSSDRIAQDDVRLLRSVLPDRDIEHLGPYDLPGGHFAPLTLQIDSLADTIISSISHNRMRVHIPTSTNPE